MRRGWVYWKFELVFVADHVYHAHQTHHRYKRLTITTRTGAIKRGSWSSRSSGRSWCSAGSAHAHLLVSSIGASIVLEVPLEKKVPLGYHSPVRAGVAEW